MESLKSKTAQEAVKTNSNVDLKKGINLEETPTFENVKPMLTTPLEITRDKLRLMNMVDENIIIHDSDIKQDCE